MDYAYLYYTIMSVIIKNKYRKINIVIDGDSIDAGQGVGVGQSAPFTGTICQYLPKLIYGFINVSVGGQTIGSSTPNMITRSSPTPYYDSISDKNILLMGGGTNDICIMLSSGYSVANIFSFWQTYYDARVAEGWKVIPRTILPRSQPDCGNVANFNTDRASLNILIRNFCTANNVLLCDCAADSTIGIDGASDNTTYYNTDKVHLIQAGANILGSLYGEKIILEVNR